MNAVIAAIDLGPSSVRVLFHAAGFARLLAVPLRVVHVTADISETSRQRVLDFCTREGPYEVNPEELDVVVRAGTVSEVIHREAVRDRSPLVVLGARGNGGFAKLLLGSTSDAVLRNAPSPVLLVPPIDLDIVNISDRPTLTCGPVLAAVDLDEACERQLRFAADLAAIASQPLLLMTVAPQRLDDHAAGELLRERSHDLRPDKPHALIVRRGDVAEEISRCALSEGAGLVVMGLRSHARSTPGVIASGVLRTKRAFVMAVPCE